MEECVGVGPVVWIMRERVSTWPVPKLLWAILFFMALFFFKSTVRVPEIVHIFYKLEMRGKD